MGINQLYNHVPYWASYSGAMSVLSIRPNLASYRADAIDNKMGINKLRRLVSFLKANPQAFNSEERTDIRGMILEPVLNYTKNRLQDYKLQDLAQKGIKRLNKIEEQKPIEEFKLDFPVPDRDAVPPPVPQMPSEIIEQNPPVEIKEQERSAIDAPAVPDAAEGEAVPPPEKPIVTEPEIMLDFVFNPREMQRGVVLRPMIDIWLGDQESHNGIADTVLNHMEEKKNDD